jgi:cytochrome P450
VPLLKSGKILGHYRDFSADPLFAILKSHALGGERVRIRLAHITAYLLSSPEDVKRVLVDDADGYAKTTRGYELLRFILGNGLVTSEGDFWLRQRRIAQPGFHKKCLETFSTTMVKATEDLADRWAITARTESIVDIAEAMNQVTLRIAGDTLMSVDMTAEAREVSEAMAFTLERFNELVNSPLPSPHMWPTLANLKLHQARKTMHRVVDRIIHDRRRSGHQVPDLLGMFMSSVDEDTGVGMTDQQLRDEVLTMLLAGHETTANGLAWAFYLLSLHPQVMARMQAELDVVLGGRSPTIADLQSLGYTNQVVKETLRLYPPVWMLGRKAKSDREMGGYRIRKGAFVFFSPWAIHRNPRHWAHAEAFDPDRFGPDHEAPNRFTYLPFSRGQRQCIGDRFAEMEMVLVLATLAQRFDWTLVPGQKVVPDPTVTLRPKYGLAMKVSRRSLQN